MPLHESIPCTVTLTVMVDGHVLAFSESGKAAGARYHGKVPAGPYRPDESLEAAIRAEVAQCLGTVSAEAVRFLARAYPVAGDGPPADTVPRH